MRHLTRGCICLVLIALAAASAAADTITVAPSLFGSTRDDAPSGFDSRFDSTTGDTSFVVGLHRSTGFDVEYNGWVRFDIPDLDGPAEIVSATLTVNVADNWPNPIYPAGIRVYYMDDDTWTNTSITNDYTTTGTYVENRPWSNSGGGLGQRSNDITTWLNLPGEGQGQLLSMKFDRIGGGNRGANGITAWMTLETQEVPEPMTLTGLLIGAGALALRRRRR